MNQDPIISIQLPVSAVNVLLQALGEIPTRLGMPIINHISPQVQRQINGPVPDGAANDGVAVNAGVNAAPAKRKSLKKA